MKVKTFNFLFEYIMGIHGFKEWTLPPNYTLYIANLSFDLLLFFLILSFSSNLVHAFFLLAIVWDYIFLWFWLWFRKKRCRIIPAQSSEWFLKTLIKGPLCATSWKGCVLLKPPPYFQRCKYDNLGNQQ